MWHLCEWSHKEACRVVRVLWFANISHHLANCQRHGFVISVRKSVTDMKGFVFILHLIFIAFPHFSHGSLSVEFSWNLLHSILLVIHLIESHRPANCPRLNLICQKTRKTKTEWWEMPSHKGTWNILLAQLNITALRQTSNYLYRQYPFLVSAEQFFQWTLKKNRWSIEGKLETKSIKTFEKSN